MAITAVCVGKAPGIPGPVTLDAPPVPRNIGKQAGKAQTAASAGTVCMSREGEMSRPVADTRKSSVNCDRGGTKPCPPHTPARSPGAFSLSPGCHLIPTMAAVPHRHVPCREGSDQEPHVDRGAAVFLLPHEAPGQQLAQHGVTVAGDLCVGPRDGRGGWSAAETPGVS